MMARLSQKIIVLPSGVELSATGTYSPRPECFTIAGSRFAVDNKLKDDAVDENGEGGKQHFIMLSIGFSINTKDKGYLKATLKINSESNISWTFVKISFLISASFAFASSNVYWGK